MYILKDELTFSIFSLQVTSLIVVSCSASQPGSSNSPHPGMFIFVGSVIAMSVVYTSDPSPWALTCEPFIFISPSFIWLLLLVVWSRAVVGIDNSVTVNIGMSILKLVFLSFMF